MSQQIAGLVMCLECYNYSINLIAVAGEKPINFNYLPYFRNSLLDPMGKPLRNRHILRHLEGLCDDVAK